MFTRVGATDDIAGGRSTFMIEMTELATILDAATENSLVLLDEVGRGTSTADGLAIARAVTEYLHDEVGAYTLFATHHHDLTAVAAALSGATTATSRPAARTATFADHELAPGPAAASDGVEVASMAGVPDSVVERSRDLRRMPRRPIRASKRRERRRWRANLDRGQELTPRRIQPPRDDWSDVERSTSAPADEATSETTRRRYCRRMEPPPRMNCRSQWHSS